MILLAAIGKNEISTEFFAKHFFSLLNIPFEERESSNYFQGGYFKGVYNGVVFTVFANDMNDAPNMPLGISVEGKDETAISSAVNFIIRETLISEGSKFLERKPGGQWISFN